MAFPFSTFYAHKHHYTIFRKRINKPLTIVFSALILLSLYSHVVIYQLEPCYI